MALLQKLTPEQIRALKERRAKVQALNRIREQNYIKSKTMRVAASPQNIEKELAKEKENERKERNAALRSIGGTGGKAEREQLADEMRLEKNRLKEAERLRQLKQQEINEERIRRVKANLLRLTNKK